MTSRWVSRAVAALFATSLAACSGNPTCRPDQLRCGDACVDATLDPNHCGSCDHACDPGDVCSVGACNATCLGGLTGCDGRCIDPMTDHDNCGSCGSSCGGSVCSAGACAGACAAPLEACGSACVDLASSNTDCGACGNACARGQFCDAGACTTSKIEHVVLIVEENHTFDTYFGNYCTAEAGSEPTCTEGPSCCEAAPLTDPTGASPTALDDFANELDDRDHDRVCEVAQIDGGLMDHYVTGSGVSVSELESLYTYDCSDPHNFALADSSTLQTYWTYADQGALADRYFQPSVGSTSANDMYLAVAQWQFDDNTDRPDTIGSGCLAPDGVATIFLHEATVADMLVGSGITFRMYADGYADAVKAAPQCASAAGIFPADCESFEMTTVYSTCNYDPSDLPFEYYPLFADNPRYIVDSTQFAQDVAGGQLPQFAYVKPRTYRNEHPKWSTISRGIDQVTAVVNAIENSPYASNTLILLTWDEGGGFYDHVSPPATVATRYDHDANGAAVPYGTRVPMLAIGPFAAAGTVSHVQMEHSSVVRFLEYNFLGPKYAGALGRRDAVVNNLGSLLDPSTTGITIPP